MTGQTLGHLSVICTAIGNIFLSCTSLYGHWPIIIINLMSELSEVCSEMVSAMSAGEIIAKCLHYHLAATKLI